MIITVDPSQSEDIAAFAMVKQYRMQALNVTLNGGTGSSAWQAVQGGEGYTQTVVTPVTGIELVYDDPNAIVSYTVENDDTSNYDVASDAGIILSSIEPTDNAWTYTCVFHADSVPVSSVDIDLLVYGNTARGTEQQGSPATAEEITAQVLAGLETRVTALEEEMPDKVDKLISSPAGTYKSVTVNAQGQVTAGTNPDTLAGYGITDAYTKTEADTLLGAKANDNAVVHKAGTEEITGTKTFSSIIYHAQSGNQYDLVGIRTDMDITALTGTGYKNILKVQDKNSEVFTAISSRIYTDQSSKAFLTTLSAGNVGQTSEIATVATLDAYLPMVRTANAQTIGGLKTFTDRIQGAANYGTGGVSTSMTAGQYNTVFILPKANISAFRGVIFAVAFRRAVGSNPVFVSIAFHGTTAVGISKWGSETATTEFFTSEDSTNVYIGIKAKINGLDANSIQMILLNSVGMNITPTVNNGTGTPADAPPGTLIAETS